MIKASLMKNGQIITKHSFVKFSPEHIRVDGDGIALSWQSKDDPMYIGSIYLPWEDLEELLKKRSESDG